MKKVLIALALLFFWMPMAFADSFPEVQLSGSITTGGTFQTLDPAIGRISFEFQNNCNVAAAGGCVATTDNCYLFFGSGAATKATSQVVLAPGAYYGRFNNPPSSTIQITCDGTGDKFGSQKQ